MLVRTETSIANIQGTINRDKEGKKSKDISTLSNYQEIIKNQTAVKSPSHFDFDSNIKIFISKSLCLFKGLKFIVNSISSAISKES